MAASTIGTIGRTVALADRSHERKYGLNSPSGSLRTSLANYQWCSNAPLRLLHDSLTPLCINSVRVVHKAPQTCFTFNAARALLTAAKHQRNDTVRPTRAFFP